jgi:hypothetical protein
LTRGGASESRRIGTQKVRDGRAHGWARRQGRVPVRIPERADASSSTRTLVDVIDVPAPFLFDPDRVAERLKPLPALAAQLHPPKEEEESVAFPGWRKSKRQIFKPLADVEGTHGFNALLERVDHWLARGFGAKALRARDRASWRAALAELEVADHFEARGFVTRGLDEARGHQRVADMRVERDGLIATVEVHSPVDWEGLDYFKQDAWDTLRQLDLPYTYLFHFDVSQLQPMMGGTYRPLHPAELTRGLDTLGKRRRVLEPLFDAAVADLERGASPVVVERCDDELNISVRLELEQVAPLAEFAPRPGTHGGPGIGGYRPELIFDDVIERALAKAGEGQARTGPGLAVLIVDISRLPLESEFGNQVYQRLFAETLDRYFPGEGHLPVDILALCQSRGWRAEVRTLYAVWDDTRTTRDDCEALFGTIA